MKFSTIKKRNLSHFLTFLLRAVRDHHFQR